jgi:hypothetical protein
MQHENVDPLKTEPGFGLSAPRRQITGPPSHTILIRGRSFPFAVGQTPNVYRYALFLTTNPYVFWIAKFRKKLSEKARS